MGNRDICPWPYNNLGKCDAYFNNIFNDFRDIFYEYYKKNGFKDIIDKIDDPILWHIALYLVENYCASKIYFREDGKWENNSACESLNKWLDNKKSYFTHGLHCKGNVYLWNKTIEPLWKELEKKSKENDNNNKFCISHNGRNKKWCERHNFFSEHLKLPNELNQPICYKHVPKGYECVRPFPTNMCNLKGECDKVKAYYEKCKGNNLYGEYFTNFTNMFAKAMANGNSLFNSISDVTFSRQMQKHCDCFSLKYATPISVCLSFFGTLLILFYLKKFTPFGFKMSYRGINKKRLRDNFNEQLEYEEYARSMNKKTHPESRRNNIYYHSVRN